MLGFPKKKLTCEIDEVFTLEWRWPDQEEPATIADSCTTTNNQIDQKMIYYLFGVFKKHKKINDENAHNSILIKFIWEFHLTQLQLILRLNLQTLCSF
jgi:hypothetical protein